MGKGGASSQLLRTVSSEPHCRTSLLPCSTCEPTTRRAAHRLRPRRSRQPLRLYTAEGAMINSGARLVTPRGRGAGGGGGGGDLEFYRGGGGRSFYLASEILRSTCSPDPLDLSPTGGGTSPLTWRVWCMWC